MSSAETTAGVPIAVRTIDHVTVVVGDLDELANEMIPSVQGTVG